MPSAFLGRLRTFAALTAVAGAVLLGAGVFLYIEIEDLHAALGRVSTYMDRLKEPRSSPGAVAVSRLPDRFLDLQRDMVPYLDYLSMAPSIFSAASLLATAGLGVGCGRSRKSGRPNVCCAKCFVVMSNIALACAFIWYLMLCSLALMADRPVLLDEWEDSTRVCIEDRPAIMQAVLDAGSGSLMSVSASAGSSTSPVGSTTLDVAQRQSEDFAALCAELERVPSRLTELRGAALAGLAATVLGLCCVNGLCAAAGCFRAPSAAVVSARVAPIAAGSEMQPAGVPAERSAPATPMSVEDIEDDDLSKPNDLMAN
jgi:hypothetical protein